MKTEYRGIIAIVLSTAVLFAWMRWFAEPTPAALPAAEIPAANTTAEALAPGAAMAASSSNLDPQAAEPVQVTELSNDLYTVKLQSAGGTLTSWQAKRYDNLELIGSAQAGGMLAVSFVENNFLFPETPHFRLLSATENEVVYQWSSLDADVKLSYSFVRDRYMADVTMELTNKSAQVLTERPKLNWIAYNSEAPKSSFLHGGPAANAKHPLFLLNDKVTREANLKSSAEAQTEQGVVTWAGVEERYFVNAIVPHSPQDGSTVEYGAKGVAGDGQTQTVSSGLIMPKTLVSPGQTVQHQFSVYVGPKDLEQLKLVGYELDRTLDYGWFAWAAHPILYLLKFFYKGVQNYGLAIILLTLFIKILLNPITKKSMKSMKAMQQLQPKLKKLQEKYKDDKAQLQQETMQLFRTHKVNPAGGCLPMLLQFPVYIALYKVLWNGIELYHAPFVAWYHDLAAPDPYFILPILLGVFMVLQQKLMPSASMDPAQKKMMMFMPIMFTAFMLFLPVGLVLYILVNTFLSVSQQWMYNNDITFKMLFKGKWKAAS